MRTTIDLPDDLFRQAKARADQDGISFKKLLARFIRQGLDWSAQLGAASPRAERSELPIVRPTTGRPLPIYTNAELEQILDDQELADGRTS